MSAPVISLVMSSSNVVLEDHRNMDVDEVGDQSESTVLPTVSLVPIGKELKNKSCLIVF